MLPRGGLCAWRLGRSIWRRFSDSSLSIVAPNVTLRARDETYATRTDITHDREQPELTWSTKSEPQHGRTGEKLRENPTMLTARPASDCREERSGDSVEWHRPVRGVASLPAPAVLAHSFSLSLTLPSLCRPAARPPPPSLPTALLAPLHSTTARLPPPPLTSV